MNTHEIPRTNREVIQQEQIKKYDKEIFEPNERQRNKIIQKFTRERSYSEDAQKLSDTERETFEEKVLNGEITWEDLLESTQNITRSIDYPNKTIKEIQDYIGRDINPRIKTENNILNEGTYQIYGTLCIIANEPLANRKELIEDNNKVMQRVFEIAEKYPNPKDFIENERDKVIQRIGTTNDQEKVAEYSRAFRVLTNAIYGKRLEYYLQADTLYKEIMAKKDITFKVEGASPQKPEELEKKKKMIRESKRVPITVKDEKDDEYLFSTSRITYNPADADERARKEAYLFFKKLDDFFKEKNIKTNKKMIMMAIHPDLSGVPNLDEGEKQARNNLFTIFMQETNK